MTDEEQRTMIIAMAIGVPLMLAGFYGIRRWQPRLLTRFFLGAIMLASGVALIYPLIYGSGDLMQSPIRFGLAIALAGLGINQIAAPVRVALGHAA